MLPQDDDDVLYKEIIDDNFCEFFLNNVEHTIMYPYYYNQGYAPDNFFEPFGDPSEKIEAFRAMPFKIGGKYHVLMIQSYLRLCVYLMSFPIDNRLQALVNEIRFVDAPLFYICAKFFNDYSKTEIIPENQAFIQQCYKDFRVGIVNWIKRNIKDIIPY